MKQIAMTDLKLGDIYTRSISKDREAFEVIKEREKFGTHITVKSRKTGEEKKRVYKRIRNIFKKYK